MSKIVQLHYKNLTTVLFNSYKSLQDSVLVTDFIRLCKSRKVVPVISNQDLISVPDLAFILNRSAVGALNFAEFENVLNDIAEIAFKAAPAAERFVMLLKVLGKKTRTLSGSEIDIQKVFGLAKQFQISTKLKDSMSQRSVLKKTVVRGKMCESLLKMNMGITENVLKTLKSEEKSGAPTAKHTRTSSQEFKSETQPGKKLGKSEETLKKATDVVLRLQGKRCTNPKSTKLERKAVKFLQNRKKSLFSSKFLLTLLLRAWSTYTKSKKTLKNPPLIITSS